MATRTFISAQDVRTLVTQLNDFFQQLNVRLAQIEGFRGKPKVWSESDFKANKLTNVADPTAAQDGATKAYVDAAVAAVATVTIRVVSSESPAAIGATAAAGDDTEVAAADHTHQGVATINKAGDTPLVGAVTFTAGANISLTQSGQDITIAYVP